MTDEQINQAIAEVVGYKWHDHPDRSAITDRWANPEKWVLRPDGQLVFRHEVPNYCNDLNAMHEAEKVHRMGTNWDEYVELLNALCDINPLYSTARQRAKAFLKTLGKWEEVQG